MTSARAEYRFDVFGRAIAIRATGAPTPRWAAFVLGPEGKRRPAEFVVPDFVAAEELAQFLADLFHESATRPQHQVRLVSGPGTGGR
jgi:hypothetical protein